jgi:hypothetical protein
MRNDSFKTITLARKLNPKLSTLNLKLSTLNSPKVGKTNAFPPILPNLDGNKIKLYASPNPLLIFDYHEFNTVIF